MMVQRFLWVALLGVLGLVSGCGAIADKEMIVIATIDGENFTRGDLKQLIYDMEDAERPRIETRSDLVRVVSSELDKRVKIPLGKKMAEEGRVQVDRNMAREYLFAQAGDAAQELRMIYSIDLNVGTTDLMEVYGLTPETIRVRKDFIELGTDRVVEMMQGEQAVMSLAMEAYQKGEISIAENLLRAEYELRKSDFMQLEWIRFIGLRFPVSNEQSSIEAANVLERVQKGESFDAILEEYAERDASLVMESEIENNQDLIRFRSFWDQSSGAVPGQIVGPVHMPSYSQVAIDAEGNQRSITQEAAFLVFKVLEQRDPEPRPIEEVQEALVPGLVYVAMMDKLREEHGVEIYEDKIPDPSVHRGGSAAVGVPLAQPKQQ